MKSHFLAGMVVCLGCGHVQRGQLDPSPSALEIPAMPSVKDMTTEQLLAECEELLRPPKVEDLPTDPVQRLRAQAAARLVPPPVPSARLEEIFAELDARQNPAPPPPADPAPVDTPNWDQYVGWVYDFQARMDADRADREADRKRGDAQHAELLSELRELRTLVGDAAQVLVQEVTGLRRIGSVAVAILSEGANPGLLAKFGISKEPAAPAPADPQLDNQAPEEAPAPAPAGRKGIK